MEDNKDPNEQVAEQVATEISGLFDPAVFSEVKEDSPAVATNVPIGTLLDTLTQAKQRQNSDKRQEDANNRSITITVPSAVHCITIVFDK